MKPLPLALASILVAGPAAASLGGPPESAGEDARRLSGVVRAVEARDRFTVHTLEVGGTVVREYVSPSGVVFAVAWNGLAHPDLVPLLGSYSTEYARISSEPRRAPGRRSDRVVSGALVLERWGHMRDLHGRAYDPALLPAGVEIDEIR